MGDRQSLPKPPPAPYPAPEPVEVPAAAVRRATRRAFLAWGAAGLAGGGGFWWLKTRAPADGLAWPLRRAHQANERASRALFSGGRTAREFPPGRAGEPKPNGAHGMPAVPTHDITIEVPGKPPRTVTATELTAGLPRVEMTTELMCIEGWSQVVTWGGVRFSDAAQRLGVDAGAHPFVGLATADGGYTVGLDAPSAWQPQTLLCDAMNGAPLTPEHGEPLRLVIPTKYGIKNIKWIGRVAFRDERPGDYWFERGYDWYAGL